MNKKNKNLTSLDEAIEAEYGPIGTPKRDDFENGFEEFKVGVMIHEARLAKGMTQTELADKCGTTKAYISKVENDVKDVRVAILRKIIEVGLGGQLELSIKL